MTMSSSVVVFEKLALIPISRSSTSSPFILFICVPHTAVAARSSITELFCSSIRPSMR
jgi:hypothetical protein